MVFSIFSKLALISLVYFTSVSCRVSYRDIVLRTHNDYRYRHGVRPLSWDWSLAEHAQGWANRCQFKHSKSGENISYGFPSIKAAIEDWYESEVGYYNFDTGRSINGVEITHLTQMVWKDTTSVGCAESYCNNLNGYFYVCNYYPPGNYRNAFVQNVNPIGYDQ
ncbi:CAP domain-containing protein [Thamnidium elegans]|nr:CAP domain-containing protein [Thamnidium elegans]